jgi:ABC-2 type transport system permease protein
VCVGVAVTVTQTWLSAKGVDVSLADNGIPRTLVSSLAVVAIYGVVGVGVGVLARNQIVGVISALAYLFVLEPLARIIPVVKNVYRYLPGAAGQALSGTAGQGGPDLLGSWAAGTALVGWGLLFAVLGTVLTLRRDVP